MSGKTAVTNSLEERAISLLASGIPESRVAEALGVSPSRISQLMCEDSFKNQLCEAKFHSLNRHNEADSKLDSLEDKVRDRLEATIETVWQPLQLARIFQIVNGAKRRGQAGLSNLPDASAVVNLTIPTRVVNNFVLNSHNQVIQAGGEDLITLQPARIQSLLAQRDSKVSDPSTEGGLDASFVSS